MAFVLTVQALVFHDGGITALGANFFNMGIVAPFIGYKFRQVFGGNTSAAFAASVASVLAAALLVSLQLSFSGAVELAPVIGSMLPVHLLVGLVEAIAAALVLAVYYRAVPAPHFSFKRVAALTAIAAVLIAPIASSLPDGLQKTAQDLEFDSLATASMASPALLAGHIFPGIENQALATLFAAVTGTALVFALILVSFKILAKK